MSELNNPQDDADRVCIGEFDQTSSLICMHQIRLKRLAKLQGAASNSADPLGSAGPSTPASPPPKPQPKPTPSPGLSYRHTPKRPSDPPAMSPVPSKKTQCGPRKLDLQSWEDETLGNVFKVTLNVCEMLHLPLSSDFELPCNLERGGRKK